jgi:hypothetical protein
MVGDNLKINLIGRQGLISLKMYAATPSYKKHTIDIKKLGPNNLEVLEAVRFVLNMDDSEPRKEDLRTVLKDIGFDFDEIHRRLSKESKSNH